MTDAEFRAQVYDDLRETDRVIREMGWSIDLSSVEIGDEAEDDFVKRIAECTKRRGTQFAASESRPTAGSEGSPKVAKSRWAVLQEPNNDEHSPIVL